VVGLGIGTIFGLQRNAKLDERDGVCPSQQHCTADEVVRNDQLTADSKTDATIATIGFVGGGVAVAAGLVLLLTAPSHAASGGDSAHLTLAPWMTPNAAGTTMGGRW